MSNLLDLAVLYTDKRKKDRFGDIGWLAIANKVDITRIIASQDNFYTGIKFLISIILIKYMFLKILLDIYNLNIIIF